jgi:hypothetical protein
MSRRGAVPARRGSSGVGLPEQEQTAASQGPTAPARGSPWRMVVSTLVTVAVLVVVFVGIFPKVADYSEAWSAIQQLPTAYLLGLVAATVINLAIYVWPLQAALPGLGLRARLRGPPDLVCHQQRRARRWGGRAGGAVQHARLLRVRRRSGRQRHRDRERLQRLRDPGHARPGGPGPAGQRRGRGHLCAAGGHRGRGHRGRGRCFHGGAAQRARRPHRRTVGGPARRPARAAGRLPSVPGPHRQATRLPVQRRGRHADTVGPGDLVDPTVAADLLGGPGPGPARPGGGERERSG